MIDNINYDDCNDNCKLLLTSFSLCFYQDGRKDDREVSNKDVAASANQKRMRRMNPFDVFDVMMNMGYNPEGVNSDASGDDDDEDFINRVGAPNCACRPS